MFDRAYIKTMAKQRGFVGVAIGVAFLATLLAGGGTGVRFSFNYKQTAEINPELAEKVQALMAMLLPVFLFIGLLGIAYSIFVGNVITVGANGWFLRYSRGEYPPVGEMFASFRIYKPAMATSLLRSLYVFLWTLLLIIPGIVMSYAYQMTDYIIYENPNLTPSRALQMSKIMTDGAKGDLFVFDLSFFGWALLSTLTCGILGIVYVNPYMYTARAGVYEALKDQAIRSGRLTWEDFGQLPPAPPEEAYSYGM